MSRRPDGELIAEQNEAFDIAESMTPTLPDALAEVLRLAAAATQGPLSVGNGGEHEPATNIYCDDARWRELTDDVIDAALFSQGEYEDGDDMAMLIDFMGMGQPELLDKARRVVRAALKAVIDALNPIAKGE